MSKIVIVTDEDEPLVLVLDDDGVLIEIRKMTEEERKIAENPPQE
jgi:hypothetical protein